MSPSVNLPPFHESHNAFQKGIAMGPLDSLHLDHADLVRLIDREVWASWADAEPALRALSDLGQIDQLGTSEGDACLGALVRRAQAGPHRELALFLVLHQLRVYARQMAYELRDLSPVIDELVLSELTAQILSCPAGCQHAFATRLRWGTRATVLQQLKADARHRSQCIETLGLTTEALDRAEITLADERLGAAEASHRELYDLLDWALTERAITPDMAALIDELVQAGDSVTPATRLELLGATSTAAVELVAARHGVCTRTIRRRRDQVIEALRTVAAEYVACAA